MSTYVAPTELMLGDVVRRVGGSMQVGVVVGFSDDVVLVKWHPAGAVDRRHRLALQRRLEPMGATP